MSQAKRARLGGLPLGKENVGLQTAKSVNSSLKDSSVSRPKTSRRRTSLKGSLATLLEIPDDIFMEVARYLHPYDLLKLARTNRKLRPSVLSTHFRSAWKSSIELAGMPECPPDLCEPQYVSLLFDKGCTAPGCDNKTAKDIYPAFRMRFCKPCFRELSNSGCLLLHELCQKYGLNFRDIGDVIFVLLPYHCVNPDDMFGAKAQGVDPFGADYYLNHDFKVLFKRYIKKSGAELDAFIRERKDYTKIFMEHTDKITEWQKRESRKAEFDHKHACEAREKEIRNRLRALGYRDGDFIEHGDYLIFEWDKLVYQPKPLTERMWKTMLPKLKDIMERKDLLLA